MSAPSFNTGERVQVSQEWFVEPLRGAVGTVAAPPNGMADQSAAGIFWIEFEEGLPANDSSHPITGAEVDSEFLTLVSPG